MSRALDAIETQLLGFPVALICDCNGPVDVERLACALEHAGHRYPTLRAHIVLEDGGARIGLLENPEFHHRSAPDGLDQVGANWDPTKAACQLEVDTSPSGDHILLHVDHAVADGTHMLALFQAIAEAYAETSPREAPATNGLPDPPSALLHRALPPGAKVATSNDDRLSTHSKPKFAVAEARIQILPDTMSAIRDVARAAGTSPTTLLSAAALMAQFDHSSSAQPLEMTLATVVDLRRRANPPVGATETTNFAGEVRRRVTVRAGSTTVDLAGSLQTGLDEGLSDAEAARDLLQRLTGEFSEPGHDDLSVATVSSLGRLNPDLGGGLPVGSIRMRPYTLLKSHPAYVMSEFGHAMSISVLLRSDLYPVGTIDELRHRLEHRIAELTESARENQ